MKMRCINNQRDGEKLEWTIIKVGIEKTVIGAQKPETVKDVLDFWSSLTKNSYFRCIIKFSDAPIDIARTINLRRKLTKSGRLFLCPEILGDS
jgi:hypothetical protein